MGLIDELKRLARPYEDEEEEEVEVEDFQPAPPRAASRASAAAPADSRRGAPADDRNPTNKVVNIHATARLQVVLIKPDRFENAADIADHLGEKRTVVLNLESTHKDIARRLVDFSSGVAYAIQGKIKKVAVSTYIITPYNVDIMGDLMDELENNGLYF